MGLLDVLNGMQNGPRGPSTPSAGGGGMSPLTMAILGLLAYKAVKSFTGGQTAANPAGPGSSGDEPIGRRGGSSQLGADAELDRTAHPRQGGCEFLPAREHHLPQPRGVEDERSETQRQDGPYFHRRLHHRLAGLDVPRRA